MASTKGLHDAPSGKVGNLIYSSWLGKPYVKINPGKRKAGNEKEKNTRNTFGKQGWDFINPIKDFLQLSFREEARGNRGMFAARSYLLKNAVSRNEKNQSSILPEKMLMSKGSLAQPDEAQVELQPDRQLLFTWSPFSSSPNSHNDDQLMLVVYNVAAGEAVTSIGAAFRPDGKATLDLGELPSGKAHVYLSFISFDRTKASDSLYLGELEV